MCKQLCKILIMGSLLITLSANVIYVDNNMNDGFWQGAYGSLQNALLAANTGDEIWVANGTYTPGMSRGNSFVLKEGVKLYGGFYGGEASLDDRDPYVNKTILCGDIGVPENFSDNCYHVVHGNGNLTNQTILDGFVIQNGYADDGSGGGGLLLENGAAPLIRQCQFYANQSTANGGAVLVENAVTFENCLFESNTASRGGAVACEENRTEIGDASFDQCTFVLNTASVGSALYFEKRESALVDSSIFWLNTDGSSSVNTFSLDKRGGSVSSVTNSAVDDASISASTVSNIIYYSSQEDDGPFKNTENYLLDNEHGIPRDYGWYYIPSPLVLNIKAFLEGAF